MQLRSVSQTSFVPVLVFMPDKKSHFLTVDENRKSLRIATIPKLSYMLAYLTQKSDSGITLKLFFAFELHLISENSSYKFLKNLCSDKKDFLSSSILKFRDRSNLESSVQILVLKKILHLDLA